MNTSLKSFRHYICTCLFLCATLVADAADLIDLGQPPIPGQLTARDLTINISGGIMDIKGKMGAPTTSESNVVMLLPEKWRDLSRFRWIEADLENTGTQPLIFTFWALSGHGWGGVSTYSSADGPVSGRETLAAGQRGTFKIDLYNRYPGKDVYTPATNPASIQSLELMLINSRSPASLRVRSIRATGDGSQQTLDVSHRLLVPDIYKGAPEAGKRVYQQLPGWEKTSVTHVLTLPREWKKGMKYPIIVEYTGNIFHHKYCYSTGYSNQGNMAYGLSKGEGYICLNLPFVSLDGQREEPSGWGDIDKTADYCVAAVRFICDNYGGDADSVFFVGFSRGELAANYLALRNDRIASLWRGFIGTNPGKSWKTSDGSTGWGKCGVGWDERAARLKGRPWFSAPNNIGPNVHVDVQYLEDRPGTVATRRWMQEILSHPPSVRSAPNNATNPTKDDAGKS